MEDKLRSTNAINTRFLKELETNRLKNTRLAAQLKYLEREKGIDMIVQKKDQELGVLRKELDQQEYTERRHLKQL